VQAHPQKFSVVKNPGKILKNMVKIPASVSKISDNPGKNGAQRRLI